MHHHDFSNGTASVSGAILSILLSSAFSHFILDASMAFVFGVIGAIGGFCANQFIIKPLAKWLKRFE